MSRALVLYDRNDPLTEPPRCRRADGPSLDSYIRNGGRARGAAFGARATVVPAADEENMPLMGDPKIAVALMKTANRQARLTLIAVMLAIGCSIGVFTGLAVVVWRVNANMDAMEQAITPHAREVVNATLDMMHDLGGSMHNVHDITEYTSQLARTTGGATGTVADTVNSTAAIAHRLADFMEHPTLSISLGGNGR